MTVVVVQSDTDHCRPRMHGGQEGRVGVRGPVVRDLQHVGAQVGARGENRPLFLELGVAGQEDAHTAHDRP